VALTTKYHPLLALTTTSLIMVDGGLIMSAAMTKKEKAIMREEMNEGFGVIMALEKGGKLERFVPKSTVGPTSTEF
jgi:hypothetical protein